MGTEMEQVGGSETRPQDAFHEGLRRRAWTIGMFVGVIWIVWGVDTLIMHGRLAQHGIVPRTINGLVGILWSPFLHTSWAHVSSNTMGILLLGGLLILRNEAHFWIVSFLGALIGGLGTWVIGRGNAVHVGASTVIFAYFGYLLSIGIFERRVGTLLMSIVVFLVWGGMLWQVLPTQIAVSWEGHAAGMVGGVVAAKMVARRGNGEPSQEV